MALARQFTTCSHVFLSAMKTSASSSVSVSNHAGQHMSVGNTVSRIRLSFLPCCEQHCTASMADHIFLLCSARLCLPWKLAQILEGTRAKGSAEQASMASALADMFPSDLTPLIDMSGRVWAHTVSTLALSSANCKYNIACAASVVFVTTAAEAYGMLRMTNGKWHFIMTRECGAKC